MNTAISRLLSVAYRALSNANPCVPPSMTADADPLVTEVIELLWKRNGFFAFGPALHVFPCESSERSIGLVEWNMPGLWKQEYLSFVDPGLCFAEDIFGNQFSIKDGSIKYFQIETGEMKPIAPSVEKWAELILSEDRLWTGWPIA